MINLPEDLVEFLCLEFTLDDSDNDVEKIVNCNLAAKDFAAGKLDLGTYQDMLEDVGENPLVIANLEETLEFGYQID